MKSRRKVNTMDETEHLPPPLPKTAWGYCAKVFYFSLLQKFCSIHKRILEEIWIFFNYSDFKKIENMSMWSLKFSLESYFHLIISNIFCTNKKAAQLGDLW